MSSSIEPNAKNGCLHIKYSNYYQSVNLELLHGILSYYENEKKVWLLRWYIYYILSCSYKYEYLYHI